MDYKPKPINTSSIILDDQILELTELLAKNAHDVWAQERLDQGWQHGPKRDDVLKEHPCLIPYEDLDELEKIYDRNTALQTLKAIIALGYIIEKKK